MIQCDIYCVEKIRKLEIQKLIKELEFLESDINLKLETINENDEVFHKEIDVFIEQHPKLKFLLEEKKQYEMENSEIIEEKKLDNQNLHDSEIISESKDPKLKSLYRQIARTTHPDTTNKENLKEVYLNAKKAYEENNLFSIVSFCEKLNLPYNLTDEEVTLLKKEIDAMKKRLKFLESTFTWQWYKRQDNRQDVILSYIKSQFIK